MERRAGERANFSCTCKRNNCKLGISLRRNIDEALILHIRNLDGGFHDDFLRFSTICHLQSLPSLQ